MKKFFTLLMMACVAVCASAVEVWSGNVTLQDYTRSEEVILPAAPFANAEVGDKLIVHFTEYTADPQSWRQVEIWTWVADTQTMGEALTQPGYHISPGDTECTFVITDRLLAALKDGVAAMAGTGYVLTSIDYESAAGGDGTLWEGESVFTSWTPSEQVIIPASYFVTAKVGDNLVYTVKCNNPEAWAAIRAEAGDWSGPIGDSDHVITNAEFTDVKVLIDAALLENLQAKGIVMVGDNVTLAKVALKPAGMAGDAAYGVLWEGNLAFDNWGVSDPDFYLEGKCFKGAVAGDKLVVTAYKPNAGEWGAFRPESHTNWAAFPGFDAYYENLTGEPTATEIELTDELATLLAAEGMHFSGTNCVVTKVELVSGFEAPDLNALWTGESVFTEWSPSTTILIPASKFADVKAGDKVVITVKRNSEEWAAVRMEAGDWSLAIGDEDHVVTSDTYTDVEIVLSEELATNMKAKGIVLVGNNITVKKVSLVILEDEGDNNDDALWSGESVFAEWSPSVTILIPASEFADVKAGDKIIITVKRNSEEWAAVRMEAGDWSLAIGDEDHVITSDTYTDVEIVLTEELAANMKAKGIVLVGNNITVTKVALVSGEDPVGIVAISTAKTAATYDLFGRKTNAAHGISIVAGRKVIK